MPIRRLPQSLGSCRWMHRQKTGYSIRRDGENMERIKSLDWYQKGLLLLLLVMVVLFTVIYSVVSSRAGFLYYDVIFIPVTESESTVYSGTVDGQQCRFTVTADKTVTFQCGEVIYGPYTAREDPTARPADKEYLTGVEIKDGDEIFFRGGVLQSGDELMLFAEDGKFHWNLTIVSGDGTVMDGKDNTAEKLAPSPATVLELMDDPKLVSKGDWGAWFGCLFLCIVTAISILFADELFRLRYALRVRDVDLIEPSDWEIASRYIGWTVITIMILVIFIMGLS